MSESGSCPVYSALCDHSVEAYGEYIRAYIKYADSLVGGVAGFGEQTATVCDGAAPVVVPGGGSWVAARGDVWNCTSAQVGGVVGSVGIDGRRGWRPVSVACHTSTGVGGCGTVYSGGQERSRADGDSGGRIVEVSDEQERRDLGAGDRQVDVGEIGYAGSVGLKYTPPHRRGPNGGVSVGRGKHYEKNQAARRRRKEARNGVGSGGGASEAGVLGVSKVRNDRYGTFAACTQEQRDELQCSRAERLSAENKLKTAKARRDLELLQAQDVMQLKKRQETKLMRDTEMNKVQVERAFGTLASTGNVSGFAQTVVSTGESGSGTAPGLVSGSISPNSSVSMAEIHAMQKENLEMKRREEMLAKENPELYAKIFAAKLGSEKTGWTLDQDGNILGVHDGLGGYVGSDGRFHEGEDYDSW